MLTRTGPAAPAARRSRFSVGRIALAMGACGLVLIAATVAFVGARERQVASREARMAAESAAYSLADHASRLFEVADLALRTATLSLGDRSWDEAGSSKPLWDELHATSDALPYLRDLLLVDADGRVRLATLAFPTPDVSLSDATALAAAREGMEGLVVSAPLLGRVTGRPSFLVARRLSAPDGSLRGLVAATAELDYFRNYWRRLDLPNDAHIALVRADGGLLVRLPEASATGPTSLPALEAAIAAAPLSGAYVPVAGRLAFFHRVGELPLYVSVSYSGDAVVAAWWSWMEMFLLFPVAAVLAVLALRGLARRQSRVEARANLEVSRARAALAAANGRLEQRVAERTAALEESNAEIQRFAYIVSHDLRAPLVNIMGFTSELERLRGELFTAPAAAPSPARDDFDEAIGFIRSSIDKMDRLIKAILMLARQGGRVFQPEPVDMGALMRSVADGVAHRAAASGATVAVGPMPTIVVDRIAAEQVFSNLIDNAVKYLRPGVPGTVVVSATEERGRAVFRVADDGRGIDPRDHARVFELFRRSGAQDKPGEGIGLAHVKALVRQLGGTIALASALGGGSTFTVTLPRISEGNPP